MKSLSTKNKGSKMITAIMVCLSMFIMTGFLGCCHYASPGSVLGQGKTQKNKVITFSVIGKGVEPEASITRGQSFIMAERAAILDGYRLLVEKIKGIYVDALTQAGMNSIDYDLINTRANSLLRGVQINNISHNEYGIAQVNMQLRIKFTMYDMIWWPEGLSENVIFTKDSFAYVK